MTEHPVETMKLIGRRNKITASMEAVQRRGVRDFLSKGTCTIPAQRGRTNRQAASQPAETRFTARPDEAPARTSASEDDGLLLAVGPTGSNPFYVQRGDVKVARGCGIGGPRRGRGI